MIRVNGLTKRFGDLTVFDNITTHIRKGECIALIGPSGTGKSVFSRTIALLEKPDNGTVFIDGEEITAKGVNINKVREKMGMVYQGFHLFSHLNVLDNITLAPVKVRKQEKKAAEAKAMELLALVGLTDKARSFPHELSGGQQQRIAIARCLAMEPGIMLFDEPTSALDPTMTGEVLSIIRKLTRMGLTMLIVTHEMKFARDVSDRVFYMDEGGIYEEGTPEEIFDHPRKEKTKAFIRKLRIFNHDILSKGFDMVAMNALIETFCGKYNLEQKQVNNIQLFLEELIVEVFTHCFTDTDPEMHIAIEYSDETNDLSICLTYRAAGFNPFAGSEADIDHLGILLINKMAKSRDYQFDSGINTIRIRL